MTTDSIHLAETAVEKRFWCNFCGYTSDDVDDYLAHSCVKVIEAKGQKVEPTGKNECS